MRSSGVTPDPSPDQPGVAAYAIGFAHHMEDAHRTPAVGAGPSGSGRAPNALERSGENELFQLVAGKDPGVIQPRIQSAYLCVDDRPSILPPLQRIVRKLEEILKQYTMVRDALPSPLMLRHCDEVPVGITTTCHEGLDRARSGFGLEALLRLTGLLE